MIEVRVTPDPSPADVTPTVTVTGLAPDAATTVVIDLTDAAGHAWRSATPMRTGADGSLDTATLPDPSRPWWDMAFAEEEVPVAFAGPAGRLDATVSVDFPGGTASRVCSRVWAGERRVWTSSGDGYQLTVVFPDTDGPAPAVLVVPGVGGPAAARPLGGMLAAHGYVAGIVTYIEAELLPDGLEEVPVEAFARALADLAGRPEVDPTRLAVHASSFGTGGALLMLCGPDAPAVRAVVLVAPTSVVWQAQPSVGAPPKRSSWSRAGIPLPWLPSDMGKVLGQLLEHGVVDRFRRRRRPSALRMLPAHESGLHKLARHPDAVIPVERVAAPMLLVAGAADAMWPSGAMARAIVERRDAGVDRVLELADTGHLVPPPVVPTTVGWTSTLVSGGTAEGNAAGSARAWAATLEFLAEHLA